MPPKASPGKFINEAKAATQQSSLLDGEFDEQEGRDSFLAALNEWRSGGSSR